MAASENPLLAERAVRDPHFFCTAYKRQRFYMFTRSEPECVPPFPRFLPPSVDPTVDPFLVDEWYMLTAHKQGQVW